MSDYVDLLDLRRLLASELEFSKDKAEKSLNAQKWIMYGHWQAVQVHYRRMLREAEKLPVHKCEEHRTIILEKQR